LQGVTSDDSAGRRRAAVELIASEGATLRRAALRYSLCLDDAEDAYQRALEILLTKAPSGKPRDLVRWTQTVVKHEALAIRANRERLLGGVAGPGELGGSERVALIPAAGDGPQERTERSERIARSREALRALKPAELRALTLLAAGYSYAEIGQATGFSQTKVNRCLAEGRERFRRILADSEEGRRCAALGPLLSAFCDGETSAEQAALAREHLRACAACRATMRAYRAAPASVAALTPAAIAALAPGLPASRSLLHRLQELLSNLQSRLPGGGAMDSSAAQVAGAGGAKGVGAAALAKAMAICAGTVGGAAACVATGVAPMPLDLSPAHGRTAKVERVSPQAVEEVAPPAVEYEPAAEPPAQPERKRKRAREEAAPAKAAAPAGEAEPAASETGYGAVEYAPPPATPPPVEAAPVPASSDNPAGEFGP
jgi:RNA polymerase sigma factor (sigma-70 family)